MKVANPIYDSVFKSLMEDLEIAKELIGRLINARVIELTPLPQEVARLAPGVGIEGVTLRYFRLDYAAVIESPELQNEASAVDAEKFRNDSPPPGPGRRRVLIELQRAIDEVALIRFRNFLSKHYAVPVPKRREPKQIEGKSGMTNVCSTSGEDVVDDTAITEALDPNNDMEPRNIPEVLPIIAIYLLGFNVIEEKWPVIDIDPVCRNRSSGEKLAEPNSQFIRALNHRSIIVQLRNLSAQPTTPLANALSVFNQKYRGEDDRRIIEVPEWMLGMGDPLLKMMLRCLEKLTVDEQTLLEMEAEDSAWSLVERLQHQTEATKKAMTLAAEAQRREAEAQQREAEAQRQKEAAQRLQWEAHQKLERMREAVRKMGMDPEAME